MRILVVDDEKDITDALTLFLEMAGHQSLACQDGITALDLLRRNKFDLVLTDVGMPRMNGIELVRELRTFLPQQKVICLSAYADIMKPELVALNVAAVIEKPVDFDDIMLALGRL